MKFQFIIKGKPSLKDLFQRFPHIESYILKRLDKKSLYICREVCKPWRKFIDKEELPFSTIEMYTGVSKEKVKKILRKTGETPKDVAIQVVLVYTKFPKGTGNINSTGAMW